MFYGGEDDTVGSDEGVADFLNDLDTSSGEDEPPLAVRVCCPPIGFLAIDTDGDDGAGRQPAAPEHCSGVLEDHVVRARTTAEGVALEASVFFRGSATTAGQGGLCSGATCAVCSAADNRQRDRKQLV